MGVGYTINMNGDRPHIERKSNRMDKQQEVEMQDEVDAADEVEVDDEDESTQGDPVETEEEDPEMEAEEDEDEDEEAPKSAAELVQELRDKYAEIGAVNDRLQDQISKGVVNPIELGRWIGVNPPRIYQDIRDGRLTAVTENSTQHKVIELREAIAYASRVLDRRVELAAKKKEADDKMADRIEAGVLKRLAEREAAKKEAEAKAGQAS
jgi:hypothetical protein